jgi:arylsulfatase A-like enzyme
MLLTAMRIKYNADKKECAGKMKKNIVMIMADQLRKDYLGCFGNPYVRTPNLDEIGSKGVRFDNCYVNNPICMPNRMSIFTGLHPRSHGMWTNGLMLPHTLPTLGNTLHDQGYDTCSIGKLHFEPMDCGEKVPRGSKEDHRYWKEVGDNFDWNGPFWGFDHVEFTIGHVTAPLAHYGKWFHAHGGTDDMTVAKRLPEFPYCPVTTMPESLHDSQFVGERAADYIRNHAGGEKPFFVLASFPDPHHPFNPPYETALRYRDTPVKLPVCEGDDLATRPEHYRQMKEGIWHRAGLLRETPGMSDEMKKRVQGTAEKVAEFMDEQILADMGLASGGRAAGGEVKDAGISSEERDQRIRNTYAMVDLIDQGVGRILEALRETGTLEDTIILVTSDHGELMGDHGLWLKGPFFYDGLLNVPLIIRAPGVEAGCSDALASSIDLYPTLCELAGVKTPRYCEGVSLVPALTGGHPRSRCLIEYRNGYFERDINTVGYLDERYKFIQYQTGECELTDRIEDPLEQRNLAADISYRDVVRDYREKLLMALLETGSRFPDQICHA